MKINVQQKLTYNKMTKDLFADHVPLSIVVIAL